MTYVTNIARIVNVLLSLLVSSVQKKLCYTIAIVFGKTEY